MQNSNNSMPKIVACIPAYNEERSIAQVVSATKKYTEYVIVVDDCSIDNTATLAERSGAHVIRHRCRKGAGGATQSCFEAALVINADILITLDGDSQHDPAEIPGLVAPIVNNQADIVIGSRFLNIQRNMPKYRRFGIRVITWLFNLWSKVKLSDTQSCFRTYGKNALNSLHIEENGFGFSVEILEQARQKGLVILEVPINCTYNSTSHSANPIIHGSNVVMAVFRLRFQSIVRRLFRL